MNRNNISYIFLISFLFSTQILWDLGVGITNFSLNGSSQAIQASTFHRLEGIKKYYEMDYNAALFHFEKIEDNDLSSVMYEYLDCHYSLGSYTKALDILGSFPNHLLTDNILYLKSKIYLKLSLYNESRNCLLYLKDNYEDSDYRDIINFEIQKINLLNNE